MTDIYESTQPPASRPISGSTPVTIALLVTLVGGAFWIGNQFGKIDTRAAAHDARQIATEKRLEGHDVEHKEFREAITNLEVIAAELKAMRREHERGE